MFKDSEIYSSLKSDTESRFPFDSKLRSLSGFVLCARLSLRRACEELVRTLGFDWVVMFMEEHLHPSTVTAALRILVALLSSPSILVKFKEGLSGGGWLEQTDSVLTNKIGTVLGRGFSRQLLGNQLSRFVLCLSLR